MSARVRVAAVRVALFSLALGIIVAVTWPVRAAVELTYYTITSISTGVVLQWATASEYNLEGFEVLCKQEAEPDTAFHPIGSRIAQGGPELAASYDFPVVSGLTPGVSYCFRIREITTDGTPGDVFERCGYGPNVTPTPGLGATPTLTPVSLTPTTTVAIVPTASLTPIVVTPITSAEQNAAAPTATTPVQSAAPVAQPTATSSPISPLDSPLATPVGADTTGLNDAGANVGESSLQTGAIAATRDAQAIDSDPVSPLATPMSADSPLSQPTATPLATATPAAVSTEASSSSQAPTPQNAIVIPPTVQSTPTSPYVVVTSTPTSPPPVALATFTPLPTVTPTPGFSLAELSLPSSENLLLLTLCFVFVGASGLGVLGLTTIGLYIRSRSSRSGRAVDRYDRERRRW